MLRVTQLVQLLLTLVALSNSLFAAGDEGVAPSAARFDVGGFSITSSMVTGWVISALLVLFVLWLIGKPSVVPSRGQAVIESLIEALHDILEPIIGKRAFPTAFPILITFFIFILFHNWMGLIPGVGTIGWGHDVDGHFHLSRPLIRPFNSDFNGTIALAAVSFGAWLIIVLKFAGPAIIAKDLFGNKAEKTETPGWLYPILSMVFLVVGLIEVVSIAIRPFTLSVRLFGNVFGGENLLHGTSFIPVFYFMELLVGLVQALVFTLLTSVYIGLLVNHGDDHAAHHEDPAKPHH